MREKVGVEEALIYAMVTMSAVDRDITDKELRRIGAIVSNLPVFKNYDIERLVHTAEACGDILGAEDGLDRILNAIAEALPKKLYETAYALAVEIAAADLDVREEEVRFLELLANRLKLDRLTTVAIERGARARHQTL